MALRTVGVKLTAEVSGYMAGLRQAGAATKSFVGDMDKAARAGRLDQVADQAALMGVGMLGAAGMAAKFAMDFEKQMSAVQAATKASAGDMERLREAALQAGKDTSYSATEAAQGIEELAKAGVSTSAILTGGLRGALDLAAAGGLDVAEAAETAASAMTQFGLKGADVPHIADLLAAAAGKAQGSVHDMGYALSQAGLVAHQMGLSVEDTTGTLAAFASAGLLGSDSGTSLKTALLMLAKPSGDAADLMAELGIQTYDAQGQFVGITKLAGQLKTQLGGLTQEQRNAALATIFGQDAIRAASVLYEQGAEGIQTWIDKTNDAGYAAETAAMRTDNLAGDLERLRGSLETLAIESASGPNSGLRVLVQTLDSVVNELSDLPPAVGSTLTVMAALGGATTLLGAGWVKARRANAEFRAELEATGPAGARAARGLEATTKWAGRAAVAFAALQVTGAIVNKAVGDLNPQVEAMSKGLESWGKSGQVAGEAARVLGADMKDLNVGLKFLADTDNSRRRFVRWGQDALESIPGMESMNTSLARTRERVSAMDQAFAQLVSGGKTEEAQAAFNRLAAEAGKTGVSVDELKKLFPQYAAALETTAAAAAQTVSPTSSLTGVTKEYKTAADAAAAAARGQRDALVDLASKMKAETDPVFGLLDAQQKLTEAQKAAAAAVKEHGRNSSEAQEATRKLALAAIELQSKAGELSGTFDGQMTPALRATLLAAGLTERQVSDVATQFRTAKANAEEYAGDYRANASAPGATAADEQLKGAKAKADAFDGSYSALISVVGYPVTLDRLKRLSVYQQALKKGAIPANFQGPVQGRDYATGGWTGPGDMYEPAGIVHADEFVIRKASRRKLEQQAPGLLDHMNRHGTVPEDVVDTTPGYAGGGQVWPYRTTAAKTRIPSRREVLSVVAPGIPTGGATAPAIVAAVKAAFPHLRAISTYRPGATTLTGNRSYHADNRAVDFPPSRELAVWWNQHYMSRTKELISPWQEFNIHNGRRHTYTGAVWQQHNFAGGNAHDHIAMDRGGVIGEPVWGVGVTSGKTYSFAERGPEWVTTQPPASGGSQQAAGGVVADPAVLAAAIRGALHGVSVQMDGHTVGYIMGRQADVYAR
ncbi:phage tail tape measure protein [Micromonospora sp. NBC_01655]|uniref:phage tail tape measure protein n=1 Tax=Micromonospora sp. NBC_01655 TaxID=2975983 RepID=UPI0022592725|nr:phage tail tape measure protein [Micromonospora sp. NBC_01655]MCX4470443.1 phage tail tape measure protein [Micromonospora sp. NBC_01655]